MVPYYGVSTHASSLFVRQCPLAVEDGLCRRRSLSKSAEGSQEDARRGNNGFLLSQHLSLSSKQTLHLRLFCFKLLETNKACLSVSSLAVKSTRTILNQVRLTGCDVTLPSVRIMIHEESMCYFNVFLHLNNNFFKLMCNKRYRVYRYNQVNREVAS